DARVALDLEPLAARPDLERAATAEELSPAPLLLPRLAGQLLHERTAGERAQRLLHLRQLGELVHAGRARAQLARRLRAAQQQLRHHRLLRLALQADLLVQRVLPLERPRAAVAPDQQLTHQPV